MLAGFKTEVVCEKCVQIDERIERYRRLAKAVTDASTNEQAEQLIADLEAEKAALHPEQAG